MPNIVSQPYTTNLALAHVSRTFKIPGPSQSGSGKVYCASLVNRNAAVRFFQIWSGPTVADADDALPVAAAVLVFQHELPPTTGSILATAILDRKFFGDSGFPVNLLGNLKGGTPLTGGFSFVYSTTSGSAVLGTPADHDTMLQFSGADATQ